MINSGRTIARSPGCPVGPVWHRTAPDVHQMHPRQNGYRADSGGSSISVLAALAATRTRAATEGDVLDSAGSRFGRIDVLQYSAPYVQVGDGGMTGILDVTVQNLQPQIEASCYGAITATRAVVPAMIATGTGTLLYSTGASAAVPTPWAGTPGAAGAALRNLALNLNGALAEKGIYVGHVAIGAWIVGTPGTPADASAMEPDDIAQIHWDMHAVRGPAERLITH
jgi:NADP-dependent 3-hydroxy acid dehydrogenase YdfG